MINFKLFIVACCCLLVDLVCCENAFKVDDKCASNVKCVDGKIFEIVEKIDNIESIPLIGGLEIVKTTVQPDDAVKSRSLGWWDWIERFVDNHSLRFADPTKEVEEGRMKRLKKYAVPLLIMLKLKMGLILPTILSAITLIAIKGVMAGIIAIILSSITALKTFGGGKQDRVTAIVAPISSDLLKHHSDYGNRWSRLGLEAQSNSASLLPQSLGPTSNLLTQAYAPDPSLDPYSAYSPYPTMINTS